MAEAPRLRAGLLVAAVSICIAAHAADVAPSPDARPCVKQAQPPCESHDRDCVMAWFRAEMEKAQARYKAQPIRQVSTWSAKLQRPLDERVVPFPAAFFEPPDESCTWARRQGQPVATDDPLLADVRHALEHLPAAVRRLADRRVAAVALAEGLEGSATAQEVYDAAGHAVAGVIVLDASILRRFTLNTWATWKESQPFTIRDGTRVQVRMASEHDDTRSRLIEYALLHELGHVLSWQGETTHENHDGSGSEEFFRLSWIDAGQGNFASRFDGEFPRRPEMAFYPSGGLRALDEKVMLAAYAWLPHTTFPNLYAATWPPEDFAESFASYMHVVVLHRPYEVTVQRDGKVLARIGACWNEERCARKRAALEAFLGRLPP